MKTTYSLLLCLALLASACSTSKKASIDKTKEETKTEVSKTTIVKPKTEPKEEIAAAPVEEVKTEPKVEPMKTADKEKPKKGKSSYVLIETDFGNMKVELFDETPQHRDNFIKLVEDGFYNDLLFHRVIKNFMVQGGDPNSKGAQPGQRLGNGGPGYTIPAEFNDELIHLKGVLSAARQGDNVNPQKASSGSQFYIVQGDKANDQMLNQLELRGNFKYTPEQRAKYIEIGGTPFLDRGYTVFGQVIEGLDVIDKIAAVQTAPGDRPLTDVKMKMKIVK